MKILDAQEIRKVAEVVQKGSGGLASEDMIWDAIKWAEFSLAPDQ